MGGVGGVSFVTGLALIGVAVSKRSDVRALSAETNHSCIVHDPAPQGLCAQLASEAARVDALGNGGIAAMVIAGAAGVGAIAYLRWPIARPDAPAGPGVQVSPLASANGSGVVLSGSF
jgi:hypothetical protein